jgi:adenylate cyclase
MSKATPKPDQALDRHKLVAPDQAPARRWQWPAWVRSLTAIGIRTSDPDLRRRQIFCNVASIASAISALSHLVTNSLYDFVGLLPVNIYNALLAILALLAPLLHRFGDNVSAFYLGILLTVGAHLCGVCAGLIQRASLYYTLLSAGLFIFGIQNWKKFLAVYALAFAAMLAGYFTAGDEGFVLVGDDAFRAQLSLQGLINAFVINAVLIAFALNNLRRAETALVAENARAESLLEAIMPRAIADRLRFGREERIADRLENVSILFSDIVGFTPAARELPPEPVVAYLDALYNDFDALARDHGVNKIKTIGDAYMAIATDESAAGAGHDWTGAQAMACFALAMRNVMQRHDDLGGKPHELAHWHSPWARHCRCDRQDALFL